MLVVDIPIKSCSPYCYQKRKSATDCFAKIVTSRGSKISDKTFAIFAFLSEKILKLNHLPLKSTTLKLMIHFKMILLNIKNAKSLVGLS